MKPKPTHTELIAKTFHGLEEILATELTELGAVVTAIHKRAVSFEGDKAMMYKANLHLRTALRIFKPIHQFIARHPQQLYRGIQQIDWRKFMDTRSTFAIDSVVNSSHFKHSKYAALKAKDAIADQFRQHTGGYRPSVNTDYPDLRLHLHIQEHKCTLHLDSSGDSLHKRGYRKDKVRAPLNEVLAAGMVLLTGWKGDVPLTDPMCGSGTIAIEAAMLANRMAPNLRRQFFGFRNWYDFDNELWKKLQQEAREMVIENEVPIQAYDISSRAIQTARSNAANAHMYDIRMGVKDFFKTGAKDEVGVVIMNPPYDERIPLEDSQAFYKSIGDHLKQAYTGHDAWILTANKHALKHLGLRTSKKLTLFNGALPCKFHKYELYRGSKKSG